MQPEPGDSLDPAVRGEVAVELAFWMPDSAAAGRLQAAGLPVAIAPADIQQTDSTTWTMHLVLPDGEVTGTCHLRGPTVPAEYPLPAYTTVWAAGPVPELFTVYTYYGHLNQRCDAELVTEGSHPLAVSLRNTSARSGLQAGWRARAGVYRRH
jgi:hypothetical protein